MIRPDYSQLRSESHQSAWIPRDTSVNRDVQKRKAYISLSPKVTHQTTANHGINIRPSSCYNQYVLESKINHAQLTKKDLADNLQTGISSSTCAPIVADENLHALDKHLERLPLSRSVLSVSTRRLLDVSGARLWNSCVQALAVCDASKRAMLSKGAPVQPADVVLYSE